MYLGQDDSTLGTLTTPAFDVSFLSSPLFIIGIGLLGAALLLDKGQKVVRRRRKASAKRAAIRAQIQALKAGL